MAHAAGTEWWLVGSLAAVAIGLTLLGCWLWLGHELERIRGLWDDIYFQLRKRCGLVAQLNEHLRKLLRTNPKLVEDIQYLLRRMEETNDPYTHAAIQNTLLLTVLTAVEQFHRDVAFQSDRDISETMAAIETVDSRLAPRRDRFNRCVRAYNAHLNTPPFSLLARAVRHHERPIFPIQIPYWSTDAAAYGRLTADKFLHQLQSSRAPVILAPSQRGQWPGGPRVIHVELRPRPSPGDEAARPRPDGKASQ
jgi:hypothetical protein